MKTCTKVLIVFAAFWLGGCRQEPPQQIVSFSLISQSQTPNIEKYYKDFNDAYFSGKLPSDTLIDWSEKSDFMATTTYAHGRFHIAVNPNLVLTVREARLTILHESCHIQTYTEIDVDTHNHGPRWRSCMLGLDLQGAFRREMIDYYGGN